MIITVKHNFETAHRLPFLEGKCQNVHGHSWWVEWMISAPMDQDGLTVEYGAVKKLLRTWVDTYLDHGIMLGKDDHLIQNDLARNLLGDKLFIFGIDYERPWPTVEAVAELLAHTATVLLSDANFKGQVDQVRVQETHVNSAIWERK